MMLVRQLQLHYFLESDDGDDYRSILVLVLLFF